MRYFDFHSHVILKQLFDENPNIDARLSRNDLSLIPQNCSDLPYIIKTQIHQSQLANFQDEVIIGVVLYGCESFLASNVIILNKYLKGSSQHKMSVKLLQDIASNTYKSFTDFTMSRTLDKFLNAPLSFNILKKSSFDSPLPKDKINIFFLIEGCHSLVDSVNFIDRPNGKVYPPEEILSNLDVLLQKVQIVSINITHLQQSSLCNHAFSIQLTDPTTFFPHENGFTDDGRKVVQGLFDRGICVDLKHMSYKSRLDLRNDIDDGKFTNVQPLICSHVGFTGISFKDWPGFIFTKKSLNDVYYLEVAKTMQTKNLPSRPGAPAFNMTTINLFNEEIIWVIQHGGMIGLSLDRRIIGYVSKHDDKPTGRQADSLLYVDKDYITKTEWTSLGLDGRKLGNLIGDDDCVTENDVAESTEISIPARDEYFYDHILLHLKHYLQVCFDAGIEISEAQKHITIGSDFDGFINPFLNLQTVEDIPALKNYIRANFLYYIKSLTDSTGWASQLNMDEFIENLFYNNGFNFIKNYFSK